MRLSSDSSISLLLRLLMMSSVMTLVFGLQRFFDNEVTSEPTIDCDVDRITVTLDTKQPFNGNLYVRGFFHEEECRADFHANTKSTAQITVRTGSCGMELRRTHQPYGANASMIVVVSFHPLFETRQDESFAVQCVFNNEPIAVRSALEVADSLANPMRPFSQTRETECEYSIREETFDGPVVQFAIIGGRVVHRWQCDDPNRGIRVQSCFAMSNAGLRQEVVDERGCPTSLFFDELKYDDSLTTAFVPIEVFKFPDVANIRFECNISFCDLRLNECIGVTPPNCPGMTRREYKPNSTIDASVDPPRVVGVLDPTITAADVGRSSRAGPIRDASSPLSASPRRSSSRLPLAGRRQRDDSRLLDEPTTILQATQQPNAIEPASALVARARTTTIPTPNTSESVVIFKPRKPNAIVDSSATPSAARQFFAPIGAADARQPRARRDELRNVRAEPIYVAESASVPIRKRQVEPTIVDGGDDSAGQFCINKQNSALLIFVLAVLTAMSMSMSVYVVYDICSIRSVCRCEFKSQHGALQTQTTQRPHCSA